MLFSNPFIDIDRYIPESYSEMLARYPEDEKGVLVNISELNPDLISDISFYRCNYDLSSKECQLRDSFAYCKPSRFKPFALQLDPDLNAIIIWDFKHYPEVGDWSDDPVAEATRFILNTFLV